MDLLIMKELDLINMPPGGMKITAACASPPFARERKWFFEQRRLWGIASEVRTLPVR